MADLTWDGAKIALYQVPRLVDIVFPPKGKLADVKVRGVRREVLPALSKTVQPPGGEIFSAVVIALVAGVFAYAIIDTAQKCGWVKMPYDSHPFAAVAVGVGVGVWQTNGVKWSGSGDVWKANLKTMVTLRQKADVKEQIKANGYEKVWQQKQHYAALKEKYPGLAKELLGLYDATDKWSEVVTANK